jgi:hypothetical protein
MPQNPAIHPKKMTIYTYHKIIFKSLNTLKPFTVKDFR